MRSWIFKNQKIIWGRIPAPRSTYFSITPTQFLRRNSQRNDFVRLEIQFQEKPISPQPPMTRNVHGGKQKTWGAYEGISTTISGKRFTALYLTFCVNARFPIQRKSRDLRNSTTELQKVFKSPYRIHHESTKELLILREKILVLKMEWLAS